MSERKQGWYWVKLDGEWYASQYRPGHIRGGDGAEAPWSFGILLSLEEIAFEEIGPRIPTPDEMERWQLVPRAPTPDMLEKGVDMLDVTDNLIPTYQAMLWAAPSPEDS